MTTLVVGANGATGKRLVEQLLESGVNVKIIVRPSSPIPDHWNTLDKLTIIRGNIAAIGIAELSKYLSDCKAVAFCLGHNLTFKGVYGNPRKLVTNAVQLMCKAILNLDPEKAVKLVLMNTAGNNNKSINESISFGENIVIGLLRLLLPPQIDNEEAANYLSANIGQSNPKIEWVVVRPDSLIEEEKATAYTLHPSPTRSAIFNPGKTSRINVGHFMAKLILNQSVWNKWKGQMPVIYNETAQAK